MKLFLFGTHRHIKGNSFTFLHFFSHNWERRIVVVGAVSLITEVRLCVCVRVCMCACRCAHICVRHCSADLKGCSSRRQTTTILTAPVTWLHTNVLAWRISAPSPTPSRTPHPPIYLPVFHPTSLHTFPLTLLHIVEAVIWHRAAAVTTHPQPLQWQTQKWHVKKGKGCFAFLLKMKPWQQPGIIFCFQLFPWLLHFHGFLTCVNMPLYLQKRSPVWKVSTICTPLFSPGLFTIY